MTGKTYSAPFAAEHGSTITMTLGFGIAQYEGGSLFS